MPHYSFKTKLDAYNDAEGSPIPLRVIDAKNEAQATAFYVSGTADVSKSTPADYMELARAKGEIEVAK